MKNKTQRWDFVDQTAWLTGVSQLVTNLRAKAVGVRLGKHIGKFPVAKICQPLVCGIFLFSSHFLSQGADTETNSYPPTTKFNTQSSGSTDISIDRNTASIPHVAIFSDLDVGSPQLEGSAKPIDSGWDVIAGGADVWGKGDQFHFVSREITGDFDIAIRVESFTPAHLYSKAGLMIRESMATDSPHLMFFVFSSNAPRNNNLGAYELQFRSVAGSNCQSIYPVVKPPAPPEFPAAYPNSWLRVERRGNHFSAYASTNGITWKLYAGHDLALASTVKVGPALTSHNPQVAAKVDFRNYTESK